MASALVPTFTRSVRYRTMRCREVTLHTLSLDPRRRYLVGVRRSHAAAWCSGCGKCIKVFVDRRVTNRVLSRHLSDLLEYSSWIEGLGDKAGVQRELLWSQMRRP